MTHKAWYMKIDRSYMIPELNIVKITCFMSFSSPCLRKEALTMQVIYSVMGGVQNML